MIMHLQDAGPIKLLLLEDETSSQTISKYVFDKKQE